MQVAAKQMLWHRTGTRAEEEGSECGQRCRQAARGKAQHSPGSVDVVELKREKDIIREEAQHLGADVWIVLYVVVKRL